jgi:ribosome-associated protein
MESIESMDSEEKAQAMVRAADAKLARDMVLMDLHGLTLMTDYFFICSGTSTTHIRTIVDSIVETMKRAGMGGIRVEGYEAAQWVLLDYGDVVAHVMNAEQREYYNLEVFWKDAPRVPLDLPEPPGGVVPMEPAFPRD